ncbi:MAG: DNA gyrase subunit A [Clostridiales bacterium]|jgi:DNA gyrase subunit A|nr:DNA gyrase subunit A [Clostridiales bacterium]
MDGESLDKVLEVNLESEMRESYIDYAMSVIVARALPDVRDGLKPVHRRILYAMNELNLDPSKAHKKSARIVGDTMGKYHPHGESSIYDAMVRMAQDFSTRYLLVDGHGNFGSMDGDMAAAQRYTEARLSRISMELLGDIEKQTVDFTPNYDGEFEEPAVLPSRFPNLLVNGSSGIAVSMATNIPPHNLAECCDAIVLMLNAQIEGRETEIEEIMDIIKGPDFPTGASILGTEGIRQAYLTGRGKIIVRATAEITRIGNRDAILVSEVPYQANKAKIVERIAELVRERRIEGISDIRDESNREGVRVVIEMTKNADANVILNRLYKYSPLQDTFGVIMLALVGKEAKVLNLKQILTHYIDHQKDVVLRRTRYELERAKKREHILEGLLVALDHIDEVISIIRSSKTGAEAEVSLRDKFALSEEQARAIVDMRLRALTGLERERLENEYSELKRTIAELERILNDEHRLFEVIRDDIIVIRDKYGDERKTKILSDTGEIVTDELIPEEDSVITLTSLDYVKRLPLETYKSQRRGGKGIMGMQTRDEDIIKNLFVANSHDTLLFFTNKGKAFGIKAFELPSSGRTAKGMAIVNMLGLKEGERIADVIPIGLNANDGIALLTRRGIVKKTAAAKFANINKAGKIAMTVADGDEIISALRIRDGQEIFVATSLGMGIRFNVSEVRQMGRTAAGVKAIVLKEGDYVVSAGVITDETCLLFVSENGMGKCTPIKDFRVQGRRGIGLHAYRVTEKTGRVANVCAVKENEELMLINSEGNVIRIRAADISVQGRAASGVRLFNMDEGVTVAGVAKIAEDMLISREKSADEPLYDSNEEI